MIRFEDVSYTYPFQHKPAVHGISLHVAAGELVLCTGASGCGKSTLIRLANGLCPHYCRGELTGRVLVAGEDSRKQTLAGLATKMGTLFQDPEQQFFALGVEDELVFGMEWQNRSRGEMQARVAAAVAEFGLEAVLHSSIHDLSEGQKQKVGLASLCMQQPQTLILDEPTANLDPESTEALARKLLELKARGMAILVVDHRLYWLKGIADRVCVMRDGQICEQGSFALLENGVLRARYGLRATQVRDVRGQLPDADAAPHAHVQVSGLCFAWKGGPAIYRDASFGLPQGITALVGHNGAGKTTLARILAGITKPHAGKIAIAGKMLDARARLQASGLVLQNSDHQLCMRTVRQELETCFTLAGKRVDTKLLAELLQRFELAPLAGRHPQSLSGGEKQRLVVACALAKRPELLIVDEPTSGLDGDNMRRMAEALRLQAGQGRCVALITHDLELLERVGEYALRLPLTRQQEE